MTRYHVEVVKKEGGRVEKSTQPVSHETALHIQENLQKSINQETHEVRIVRERV